MFLLSKPSLDNQRSTDPMEARWRGGLPLSPECWNFHMMSATTGSNPSLPAGTQPDPSMLGGQLESRKDKLLSHEATNREKNLFNHPSVG